MIEREFHPAANIFPMMPDEDLKSLAEDIVAHGQQFPIELLDGKIIDGRNRYRVCLITGITPRVQAVTTKDPVAYVLSRNLHRRHLDSSQRGMVAARAREYYDQRAKERQVVNLKRGDTKPVPVNLPEREKGDSRDQAGKAVGVSGKTVDAATKVLAKGTPELVKAVDEGKVSVSAAAKKIEDAKKPSETMKDADGQIIPEDLREVFATQDQFETFANKLSRLKGELAAAVEANPEAWCHLDPQKRIAELSYMHHQFEEARPYLICPSCGGDNPARTCECKGLGWLSRFQARASAIDSRNIQRNAAGLDLLTRPSQRAGEETK
ncbi:MAG: hypothetical protein WC655_13980 [Candidatus Hydrogenedentales bacterium]|jgi:ParB-like chromosome segregation protein Spo0J